MAWSRVGNVTTELASWASSMTWAHTVASGNNRLLIVSIGVWDNGDTVTGVTYNGTAMTKAVETDTGTTWKSSIWYLVAPTVGTANVVATFGGGDSACLGVVGGATTFTGINQSTPLRGSATGTNVNGGTVQNPSVDVPNCTANDLVYGVCFRNGSDLTPADTADWTEYNDADNEVGSGTYQNATTGTNQLNWTSGAALEWAACGAAFVPSSDTLAARKALLGVGI